MESAEFVIIGAGLAGAATAYQLARRGATDLIVLEQEETVAVHSSGRSAAMVRQVVPEDAVGALAHKGAEFIRAIPADWSERPAFTPNGSLLLAGGASADSLRRDMDHARARGVAAEWWDRSRCVAKVAPLADAAFDGGVWCPTDGIVDVLALVNGFLREAEKCGARVFLRRPATGFDVSDGRAVAVQTAGGRIACGAVVNAAGAWAGPVGVMAGAAPLPLAPCRRHVYVSGAAPWIRADWPFVWDVAREFYFRPEAPGLLLCACDQTEHPPGIPEEDPTVRGMLERKIAEGFPRLAGLGIERSWAGLRILTPDGRFCIGWDSRVENFFWTAGIGGHGVTAGAAIGDLAAHHLLEAPRTSPPDFAPARFSREGG